MSTYATVERIRAQYPYLSDAPEHVLAEYREAQAQRVLAAPTCIDCDVAILTGERCAPCDMRIDREHSSRWEIA